MRGVAVILILGIHGFGQPVGGYLGVPLFFVLSGFLITTLLLERQDENGGVSLRRFYTARARRLGPALIVALGGYLLISAALGAGAADDHAGFGWALRSAGLTIMYVANVAQFVAGGHHRLTEGLGPMWSLSQEEQFYLLWPLILVAFFRRPKILLCLIGVTVVVIVAHRAQLASTGAGWRRIEGAPDCTPDEILVGCGLGLLRWHGWLPRPKPRQAHRLLASALAVAFVLVLVAPLSAAWSFEIGLPMFALAAAILLAGAVGDWDEGWTRLASLRPLRWMGRISYAAYLWDGIILWATPLHGAAATIVVIGMAAASTRFVEQRFRRRRQDRQGSDSGSLEERVAYRLPVDAAA